MVYYNSMEETQQKEKDGEHHIFHPSFKTKMWLQTSIIAFALYGFFAAITSFLDGSLALLTWSKALGGAAAVCIAISFSLSGFCYYFNFLDTKLVYRKYFGLTGYWFAFAYSISLLFVNPKRYFYGFFDNIFSADFILGIAAMSIFTFMALISNAWAMKAMGPQNWRRGLRLGYFAWLMLAIRAYTIEKDLWMHWWQNLDSFPPPRMLLSLLVLTVILFRISIEISKFIKKHKHFINTPQPNAPSAPNASINKGID